MASFFNYRKDEINIYESINESIDDSCKEFFFDIYDIDEEGYVKKTGVMCYEEGVGWEIIY